MAFPAATRDVPGIGVTGRRITADAAKILAAGAVMRRCANCDRIFADHDGGGGVRENIQPGHAWCSEWCWRDFYGLEKE